MAVIALLWAGATGLPLPLGRPLRDIALGLATAGVLAVLNLWLLRWRESPWPGGALRRVYRVVVQPLFEHLRLWHIVFVSALAGVGEELLFRGVLQPLVGLAAASVLFGAVHVGGREYVGYGLWAACIGLFMGWLTMMTGGLTAAIVAHAV